MAGRNLAFLTVVLIGGSSRPQQTFRQAGYEAGYVDTFTLLICLNSAGVLKQGPWLGRTQSLYASPSLQVKCEKEGRKTPDPIQRP